MNATWSRFNITSVVLGFAFLYLPIVLLVIFSFNESKLVTVWGGFSTKWYVSMFHNQLVMQAGAYQNGTWVVGVAKAGKEEGCEMIGGSCIIAPSGEVVAACSTKGDELAIARCDLDLCNSYKSTTFNFAKHRRPEAYRMIVERRGAVVPQA